MKTSRTIVPRVTVLVFNSVLHDARVLKEADSLARQGHEVKIIGLHDKRVSGVHFQRPSGVKIELCRPLLTDAVQQIIRLCQFLIAALVLALVAWYGWSNATDGSPPPTGIYLTIAGLAAFLVVGIAKRKQLRSLTIRHIVPSLPTRIKRVGRKLSRFYLAGQRLFDTSRQKLRTLVRSWARPAFQRLRHKMMVDAAVSDAPDIIHCHDMWTLPAGVAAKRQTGAQLVWDAHEIYEEVAQGSPEHAQLCRKTLRRSQRHIDGFITINDSIAAFYATHYKDLPPAVIIKNATVPQPPVQYDGRLHYASGLPETQKVVLYQGGFSEKRGLRALVAAAAYLSDEWTLVMMGWGRLEAELKEIGGRINDEAKTRANPAVCFIPAASQVELAQWSAGGTVGLIPYENVGLNHLYCTPNKLWEYPAAGVPILCSPLVEMSRVIGAHGIGWTLPEDASPEQIASVINQLDPSALSNARAACRTYIESDNWITYESRLFDLYEKLTARIPAKIGENRIRETKVA